MEIKQIAVIHTDFQEKFGIPRQAGIVSSLKAEIVFEPEYRNEHALMGLEDYSHIWLLWQFSKAVRSTWSPTVLPPRLGGKVHKGVFATRSPFRPNPIGLSCVKLEGIELHTPKGPILHVSGADLLDGTPIYDIKPYLTYTDSHPEALSGFADAVYGKKLKVIFPEELLEKFPPEKRQAIIEILEEDPRPAYQEDPTRRYGVAFAGWDVHFYVQEDELRVSDVVPYGVR